MVNKFYPVRVPLVTEPKSIWQTLRLARRNVLSIIPKIATHQNIVSGRTGVRWHMVLDPVALRHVLLENLDSYPKSDVTKNMLRPAIGDSLFIAEGAHWRWQRRAAAPAFTHRNISNLGPFMSDAAERCVKRLAKNGSDKAINMFDEMVQTTFEVISDVTFSGNDAMDRKQLHIAIESYIQDVAKLSIFDIFGLPTWVPRPKRIFSGNALRNMKSVADKSVEDRHTRGPSASPDLLDLLLAGVDPETKREMNTSELRDNLLTFIVAGHETTALTLSWALYLCAFDQTIQNAARSEAQSVLAKRTATADDLDDLPLIRMIIDETLRLYPPAAFVSRTAQEHDSLCDREIRKGDTVMIPIYALHRNHLYWDDPDQFNPYRFQNRKEIDRYTYLPFGDGPRICIGAQFAIQEAVIILATLLSRFRFSPIDGHDPEPVMILTLRPEGGVWLTANPI